MAGRFVLPRHSVRGRRGGPGCRLPREPGREPLGACPDVGPHPGWRGGGAVREGSLPLPLMSPGRPGREEVCPAHRELTHRVPDGDASLGELEDWKCDWGRRSQKKALGMNTPSENRPLTGQAREGEACGERFTSPDTIAGCRTPRGCPLGRVSAFSTRGQ